MARPGPHNPAIPLLRRALRRLSGLLALDTVNPVKLVSTGIAALALTAASAAARDSLGIYSTWGAFSDAAVPRCYAIAMAEPSQMRRDYQPFVTIGIWPRKGVRNQVHFRLSRKLAANRAIILRVGSGRFELTGGGGDAWATDRRMDAAIVAAMRSASHMTVYARDDRGNRFSNTWPLEGAATAMDAAALACARLR